MFGVNLRLIVFKGSLQYVDSRALGITVLILHGKKIEKTRCNDDKVGPDSDMIGSGFSC